MLEMKWHVATTGGLHVDVTERVKMNELAQHSTNQGMN
jgi:hypothetical protein